MHHALRPLRNQIQKFCLEQYIEQYNFERVIDSLVEAIDLTSFGFRYITTEEKDSLLIILLSYTSSIFMVTALDASDKSRLICTCLYNFAKIRHYFV